MANNWKFFWLFSCLIHGPINVSDPQPDQRCYPADSIDQSEWSHLGHSGHHGRSLPISLPSLKCLEYPDHPGPERSQNPTCRDLHFAGEFEPITHEAGIGWAGWNSGSPNTILKHGIVETGPPSVPPQFLGFLDPYHLAMIIYIFVYQHIYICYIYIYILYIIYIIFQWIFMTCSWGFPLFPGKIGHASPNWGPWLRSFSLSTGTSWVPIGTCGILVVARPSRPSRPWPGTCGHMAAWCCLFRWWKGIFHDMAMDQYL